MTQEDKELLLKDLSARLLYGIKCYYNSPEIDDDVPEGISVIKGFKNEGILVEIESGDVIDIDYVKPYLRSMSTMTDEEKKELKDVCTMCYDDPGSTYEFFGIEIFHISRYGTNFESDYTAIDWLNAHYFDYRGLIERGLALEAPEGMYK